jgi:hypothetical protein
MDTDTYIHWYRYGTGTGEHRASHAGRMFRIQNTRSGPFPFTVSIANQIGNTRKYEWEAVDAQTTFAAAKNAVANWKVEA